MIYLLKKGDFEGLKLERLKNVDNNPEFFRLASYSGNLDIVKYLVEIHKFDPNKVNVHGNNALLHASRFGRLDIVKYLIHQCKMNPNKVNNSGKNALQVALEFGHLDIVKYLEEF
jgi:ankyrin repeat protein